MRFETKYKIFRKAAVVVAFIMVMEAATPIVSYALTSGPGQPEFSSFEPVSTTDMVNHFTGDFTYNLPVLEIPGAQGGGYALSLSYHSGASPEEEASWVGYGWTLNPGAINRQKRGFPDEYKGASVKYWNKTPKNWTASIGRSLGFELFSWDAGVSLNASLRYNNYKGIGYTAGFGVHVASGTVSLGYSVTDGEGSWSASVNPAQAITKAVRGNSDDGNDPNSKESIASNTVDQYVEKSAISLVGSDYGMFSHSEAVRTVNFPEYKGAAYNLSVGVMGTLAPIQAGISGNISGHYSWQENISTATQNAYGYMYSGYATENDMMDYYVENSTPYQKRDRVMGVPFHNADNFAVSGEGIGGGFRMYNRQPGHFHPNKQESSRDIINIGVELEAGMNNGGGADIGVGFSKMKIKNWEDQGNTTNYEFAKAGQGDEPVFLRFNNDLAGKAIQAPNDDKFTASLKTINASPPGTKRVKPDIPSTEVHDLNNQARSKRSSYIAYHTNEEMTETNGSNNYYPYSRSSSTEDWINRTGAEISDGIGEIVTFNEDGTRYTYGLPVYSRNEINMQYGLEGTPAENIKYNHLAYRDISNSGDLELKVGEEREDPYASTYLLTSITTPDYIDRGMDGPTQDDFGGYTKFAYQRAYGSDDKSTGNWFKWRIPYTGLLYKKKEMSVPSDDVGTVIAGEKEVYYLDSITTKTHVAKFHTSGREDAYGAAGNTTAASDSTATSSQQLERLDSIKLYARDENGNRTRLLKTVRFEYDYTLASGVPNNTNGNGKLTLKKVWFEYEGIRNARISPYVFEYDYYNSSEFSDLSADLQSKYNSIINYKDYNYSTATENPGYSAQDIGPWGNYQADGKSRHADMIPWLDQTPPSSFDPAAWQLKVVRLPSGGEIHVQYEQDDYRFVQEKPVMTMVSLKNASSGNKYYLNLSDLYDTPITSAEEQDIEDRIKELIESKGKKIYFKFLYKLLGSGTPQIGNCDAEYIDGYVSVKNVGSDVNGVFVEVGGSGSDYELPQKVCQDFFEKNRAGKAVVEDGCNASDDGVSNNGKPKDILMGFLSFLAQFSPFSSICEEINYSKSYLKIPMANAKKGGGIRVKRLLMYDKGIENGDAHLYGKEYVYETEHEEQEGVYVSSGVATNEPAAVKGDHTLTHFMPRFEQTLGSRIISGRDKKQTEGPVGKSILPSPSVGYSKVFIKNIHDGRTNNGFQVKEFHTAKKFPAEADFTTINSDNKVKDWMILPTGLINISISNLWLSQGFSFTFNDMHGKPKRTATYGSKNYDNIHNPADNMLSFEKQFEYTQPGEQIRMLYGADSTDYKIPGTEREVIFEIKGIEETADDFNIEFDADVGLAGFIPIPFISAFPSASFTQSKLRTHATTKITRYASVQRKTTTYKDGIYHVKENEAYDPATAKPVITRTYDGYHQNDLQQSNDHTGTYHTYNYPAHQRYKAFGQRAETERRVISGVSIEKKSGGYIEFSSSTSSVCDAMNLFTPGDLVMLYSANGNGIYHTGEATGGGRINVFHHGMFGSVGNGTIDSIEIIKSGRSNQLTTKAGKIVTYGQQTLQLDSTYNGINADMLDDRQAIADEMTSIASGGEFQPTDTLEDDVYLPNFNTCGCDTCLPCNEGDPGCETCIPGAATYSACDSTFIGVNNMTNSLEVFLRFNNDTLCKSTVSKTTAGHFEVDKATGKLVYYNQNNNCFPQELDCPSFCPGVNSYTTVDKVLEAGATTFDHHWPYDDTIYDVSIPNPYRKGEKGRWKQESQFKYKADIIDAVTGNERIYKDAGVFEEFTLFNWDYEQLNDTTKWLKLNTVTRYSANGEPVEERNILGVYSTAKFGYNGTQPYLIAQNAQYDAVQFESFENVYSFSGSDYLEDGLEFSGYANNIVSGNAHSGGQSFKMENQILKDRIPLKNIVVSDQIVEEGISVKLWLKENYSTSPDLQDHLWFHFVTGGGPADAAFEKVAQTGEWSLYEAKVEGFTTPGNEYEVEITYDFPNGSEVLWIDDVRLQPMDAKMTAYVYDVNTLRLITSFDDQHFGLYYQYNAEGKLVRKLKETERGMKTIKETQYHTPLQSRN